MTTRKEADGFTLIELLVVIIIIGVLASIALPTFLKHRGKAFQAAARSDLYAVAMQANGAEIENGHFPTTFVAADEPAVPDPNTVYYKLSRGVGPVQSVALAGGGLCLQVTADSGEVVSWTSVDGLRPIGAHCPGL